MAGRVANQVVRDGLVLYLDAGNRRSYPGTGTAWNDLTINNNNGTLVNSPTFNSANAGSIVFDGTDDYATFPTGFISNLTACTVNFWFNWEEDGYNHWTRVFDFGTSTSVCMIFTTREFTEDVNNPPAFYIVSQSVEESLRSTQPISTNIWYNFTITLDGSVGRMYKNSILDVTNPSMTLTPSSLGNTDKNYLADSQYPVDTSFQGRISNFQIYNRALSAQEVLQNYNALKWRYGL